MAGNTSLHDDPRGLSILDRREFPYLDGLRGIAAISVVVFHAFLFTGYSGDASRVLPFVGWLVGYGYLGVPVFIVLSGYVLMLPLVQRPGLSFKNGVGNYIVRRARRILPPYFAAYLISLILIWTIPLLGTARGTEWDSKIPLTLGGVLSHLFLVQDVSPEWINQGNGPMWSVAVEWQIYFLLPFVLLPLWRRVPPLVIVGALILLGVGLSLFGLIQWTHPWLVGLFAAGMFAAQLTLIPSPARWIRTTAVTGAVLAVATLIALSPWLQSKEWISEIVAGCGCAALLVWMGVRQPGGKLTRVLESKPAKLTGLVSYSIYLLHSPLLGLGNLLLLELGLSTWQQYLLMMVLVVPLDLACCVLFYLAVERHFLNSRQRHASGELARK